MIHLLSISRYWLTLTLYLNLNLDRDLDLEFFGVQRPCLGVTRYLLTLLHEIEEDCSIVMMMNLFHSLSEISFF